MCGPAPAPAGTGTAAPAPEPATPAAEATAGGILFRFEPGGSPAKVFLAGEFNGWNDTANPMADEDGDGVWELALPFAPGKYAYKFVVDGSWLEDPNAAEFVDDGFGGKNSVLTVTEDGTTNAGGSGGGTAPAELKEYRIAPPDELCAIRCPSAFRGQNLDRWMNRRNPGFG